MKIGIIQSSSEKGEVAKNIQNHLMLVRSAIEFNPDLIVFPELSITGYEPQLAERLACEIDDERLEPFQEISNTQSVTIGIGMPTIAADGINISAIFFQPQMSRMVYSKELLHDHELPYFVSGKEQSCLRIKRKKIAFGICYETLQRACFVQAAENNADLFIASVAKPDRGTNKAYLHFPEVAKEFNIPILMSNCVGYCDDFLSNGKSAIWNKNGQLLAHLNDKNQGLLFYDTDLDEVKAFQL